MSGAQKNEASKSESEQKKYKAPYSGRRGRSPCGLEVERSRLGSRAPRPLHAPPSTPTGMQESTTTLPQT
eukprot:scaffold10288_cov154-Isochrysis_galbana.AAC.6